MTNIESLISAIQDAESTGPLYKNELLTGFSGESLYGTLQRLARHLVDTDQCYVFQGKTLLSVAASIFWCVTSKTRSGGTFPSERGRILFVNDHKVHSAQNPGDTSETLYLFLSLKKVQFRKTMGCLDQGTLKKPRLAGS